MLSQALVVLFVSKDHFLRSSSADFSHLIGSSPNHSCGKKDETTKTGLDQSSSFKVLGLGRSPTFWKGCDHLGKMNKINILLARKIGEMALREKPKVSSTVHPNIYSAHPSFVL